MRELSIEQKDEHKKDKIGVAIKDHGNMLKKNLRMAMDDILAEHTKMSYAHTKHHEKVK